MHFPITNIYSIVFIYLFIYLLTASHNIHRLAWVPYAQGTQETVQRGRS